MLDRTVTPPLPKPTSWPAQAPSAPAAQRSETSRSVRAAGLAMAIALVMMALFNSSDLSSYARDLPESAVSDHLVRAADRWHALMERLGPARLRPAFRSAFDRIRDVRW